MARANDRTTASIADPRRHAASRGWLSLCRKVRATSQTPIIMLTARGEDVDRILGLEMGGRRLSAKAVQSPREWLARINAVLRRQAAAHTASAVEGATALSFGGWRIDFRLRELRNPEGRAGCDDQRRVSTCLRTSCERPGRVLSRTAFSTSPRAATPARSSAASTCCQPHPPQDRTRSARRHHGSRRCAPRGYMFTQGSKR